MASYQGSVEVRPDEDSYGFQSQESISQDLDDSPQDLESKAGPETPPDEDGVEIVVEGRERPRGEAKTADDSSKSLEEENRELKKQLLEIGASLRELRGQREERREVPPSPPPDSESQILSPEQVAGLIKEHGHDPEAMARIIDYVTEQKARKVAMGIRDETMKDVNYRNWYTEQKRASDRITTPIFEADPTLRDAVSTAVESLGFKGHPLGELAVVAMMEMAKMEKSREAAEATRTKELTEKKGLDKTRGQGDAKKKIGLTQSQLDVAQKLGLDPKTYAKYLGHDAKEGRV